MAITLMTSCTQTNCPPSDSEEYWLSFFYGQQEYFKEYIYTSNGLFFSSYITPEITNCRVYVVQGTKETLIAEPVFPCAHEDPTSVGSSAPWPGWDGPVPCSSNSPFENVLAQKLELPKGLLACGCSVKLLFRNDPVSFTSDGGSALYVPTFRIASAADSGPAPVANSNNPPYTGPAKIYTRGWGQFGGTYLERTQLWYPGYPQGYYIDIDLCNYIGGNA